MSKIINMIRKNYKSILALFIIVIGIVAIGVKRVTHSAESVLEEDKLNISCDEKIEYDKSFYCTVSLNSSIIVKGISFNYMNDESVEYIKFNPAENWVLFEDSAGSALVNVDNNSNIIEIGQLELSIPNDDSENNEYNIGLNNISVGDGEESIIDFVDVSTKVSIEQDGSGSGGSSSGGSSSGSGDGTGSGEDDVYELNFDDSLAVDSENKYIKYLNEGTKVSDILSKVIVQNGNVSIYDKNNNLKTPSRKIATGDILRIRFQNIIKEEYQLSIIGDSNGDALFDISDLAQFRKHHAEWIDPATGVKYEIKGIYVQSFDFNKDGKININDLAIMRKKHAGVI